MNLFVLSANYYFSFMIIILSCSFQLFTKYNILPWVIRQNCKKLLKKYVKVKINLWWITLFIAVFFFRILVHIIPSIIPLLDHWNVVNVCYFFYRKKCADFVGKNIFDMLSAEYSFFGPCDVTRSGLFLYSFNHDKCIQYVRTCQRTLVRQFFITRTNEVSAHVSVENFPNCFNEKFYYSTYRKQLQQ